jgi:hypothetical protein
LHGYAYNQLAVGNGSKLWKVWGGYVHKLQRMTQDWKVTSCKFSATNARGNERVRELFSVDWCQVLDQEDMMNRVTFQSEGTQTDYYDLEPNVSKSVQLAALHFKGTLL